MIIIVSIVTLVILKNSNEEFKTSFSNFFVAPLCRNASFLKFGTLLLQNRETFHFQTTLPFVIIEVTVQGSVSKILLIHGRSGDGNRK